MRIPSLKGIEAFVAAAESSSFRIAAEDLHLTTSAVSRRIQSLEEQMGVQLFDRTTRTVRLTPTGQHYLDLLMPGLLVIEEAGRAVQDRVEEESIRVACSSMLASQWLQPNLTGFRQRWPNFQIEIYSLDPLQLSSATSTDLRIATINDGHECSGWKRLFGMEFFPICSAELAESHMLRTPRDMTGFPLIQSPSAKDAWSMWFRAAGLKGLEPKSVIMIEDSGAYIDAVAQGLGIGLGGPHMSGDALRRGHVRRMFDVACHYPRSVFLRVSDKATDRTPVRALYDWLVEKAGT